MDLNHFKNFYSLYAIIIITKALYSQVRKCEYHLFFLPESKQMMSSLDTTNKTKMKVYVNSINRVVIASKEKNGNCLSNLTTPL